MNMVGLEERNGHGMPSEFGMEWNLVVVELEEAMLAKSWGEGLVA
jgi:hypothetical protein